MKTTFIYALRGAEVGGKDARYVGKAKDPSKRFKQHCQTKSNTHLGSWIRSLTTRGSEPRLEILDEVPEAEWQFWEREWIRLYRALGFDLVNATDGGEGLNNPSKEVRARMSARLKGKPLPAAMHAAAHLATAGKPLSPEHCAKISAAKTGKPAPPEKTARQRGKTHGAARCLALGNARRGVGIASTSGILGIHWEKQRNKWVVMLPTPKGLEYFGRCSNKDDAIFVQRLAQSLYGKN